MFDQDDAPIQIRHDPHLGDAMLQMGDPRSGPALPIPPIDLAREATRQIVNGLIVRQAATERRLAALEDHVAALEAQTLVARWTRLVGRLRTFWESLWR